MAEVQKDHRWQTMENLFRPGLMTGAEGAGITRPYLQNANHFKYEKDHKICLPDFTALQHDVS